jgi:hypothetical protein
VGQVRRPLIYIGAIDWDETFAAGGGKEFVKVAATLDIKINCEWGIVHALSRTYRDRIAPSHHRRGVELARRKARALHR